jgi:hypothetical protein
LPVDTEPEWQIGHNARLLAEPLLDGATTQYLDWVITIMFYKAVHVIDKALTNYGVVDVTSHEDRKEKIRKHLRGCLGDFIAFEDLSRKTRYEVLRPTQTDLADAVQLLRRIEQVGQTA